MLDIIAYIPAYLFSTHILLTSWYPHILKHAAHAQLSFCFQCSSSDISHSLSKCSSYQHRSQLTNPQSQNKLIPRVNSLDLLTLIQERQPLHRLPTTRLPQRQKCKMRSDNRPCHKGDTREASITFGVVAVCEWTISACFVDPERDAFEDLFADRLRRHGGGEEFPVRFGVEVARVERKAVALEDGLVPGRLHLIDVVRDEAGLIAFAIRFRVQRYLVVTVRFACDG